MTTHELKTSYTVRQLTAILIQNKILESSLLNQNIQDASYEHKKRYTDHPRFSASEQIDNSNRNQSNILLKARIKPELF